MEGVCSECGLEFSWRDVCNPAYQRSTSTFEHARRRQTRSLLVTVALLHAPWRLWRRLLMVHWVVPRRLALFAALGLGVTSVACSMILVLLILATHAPAWARGKSWAWDWRYARYWLGYDFDGGATVLASTGVLAIWALTPLLFVLVSRSLREARVRPGHLARVLAYSTPLLAWPVLVGAAAILAGLMVEVWDVDAFGMGDRALRRTLIGWGPMIGALAAGVIVAAWWSIALRRYLRMRHGVAVGVLLTLIPTLLTAVVAVLLWYASILRAMK